MDLPSGGYIKYVYPADQTNPANDFVIERHVSYDGSSEQVWTYTRTGTNMCSGSYRETTVMSPITTERVVHCFNNSGLEIQTPGSNRPVERGLR